MTSTKYDYTNYDFDPEQAHDPERLAEMIDQDIAQPGGALYTRLLEGPPTEQKRERIDPADYAEDFDYATALDTYDVDITTWDRPDMDFDNEHEPIVLTPDRDVVLGFDFERPEDALEDAVGITDRLLISAACIPPDTHPMWFGAILNHYCYFSGKCMRDWIDDVADLLADYSEDYATAAWLADPLMFWNARDDEARERARYLLRTHPNRLKRGEALAVACLEQGYIRGEGDLIAVTDSTAQGYIDTVQKRFGPVEGWVPRSERVGPLDQTDETAHAARVEPPTREEIETEDGRTFPDDLLAVERWLCWKLQKKGDDGDKWTKVPKAPWKYADGDADPTDSENWTDYRNASNWADKMPGQWGVAYAFSPVGAFVGIDFDDCRDPESGIIDARIQDIIDSADSFAQVSTSGTGVHLFLRGKLDGATKNESEGVEMYDRQRFFAMTGDHLEGTPVVIREDQDLIDELTSTYGTESADASNYDDDTDPLAVEKIRRAGDAYSPFELIRVTDLYPELPVGERVAHPEHGSSTGSNFVISESNDGATGTCWKGEHATGHGDGCGLNAQHLIAMRALKDLEPTEGTADYKAAHNCREIKRRWKDDDSLVYLAYKYAVQNDDINLDPNPPPWRAIRHFDNMSIGIGELDEGNRQLSFSIALRLMSNDLGVELDQDPTPASDRNMTSAGTADAEDSEDSDE